MAMISRKRLLPHRIEVDRGGGVLDFGGVVQENHCSPQLNVWWKISAFHALRNYNRFSRAWLLSSRELHYVWARGKIPLAAGIIIFI